MKKINLIVILLAMFSITLLSGCTNKYTNAEDTDNTQTCSIDQVDIQESCQ